MSMDNGKIKRKINAFDIFVIFLVLCLLGTLIFRMYRGVARERKNENSEFIMRFECEEGFDSISGYVKEGDRVYLSSSGTLLGYMIKDSENTGDALYEDGSIGTEQTTSESASENTGETGMDSDRLDAAGSEKNEELTTMDMSYNVVSLSGEMRLSGNLQRGSGGSYFVLEDVNITVGSRLTVYTDNTEFTITVVEIREIEE